MAASNRAEWTAEDMRELGLRHGQLEADCDLEGTMATLVADPVYEFWPAGRVMRGREPVIRYYEHLIADFMPRQIGYRMICETVGPEALSQEYVIELRGDAGPESHRVIGILFADDERSGLLGGERIWGDDAFLRQMIGPVWDDLELLDPRTRAD